MIFVKYNGIDFALSLLEKESKPTLETYKQQMYFHPDRDRKHKKPMKPKTKKAPGGKFRGR